MEEDRFVDSDWWTNDLALTSDPQSATAASPERGTSRRSPRMHVCLRVRGFGIRLTTRTYMYSFLRPNTSN
jgi:hypothetical protein